MSIFDNHHLRRDHASLFFTALKPVGFSKLYPGDSMAITVNNDSAPTAVSYLSRLQCWYRAHISDSTITAERRPVVLVTYRSLMNGVLATSLLDEMLSNGLGPLLACKLADIFAWDINFFIDPRKGDTFRILFEQKYAEGRCIGYGDILAARYTCKGKDFFAIGFKDPSGTLQYYDQNGKSVQKEFLKAPLRFSRISSSFTYHRKHPILGIVRPHLAIDYAAPGGTPVYAAADGTILTAGCDRSYGNNVVIAHGGSYTTYYGHLASISSGIRHGTRVRQGQMIGVVGATGLATGPHLDYRMKSGPRPVNPLSVNLPSKTGIDSTAANAWIRIRESCLALLELRCRERHGCTVLDIAKNPPCKDSCSTHTERLESATNGSKRGS